MSRRGETFLKGKTDVWRLSIFIIMKTALPKIAIRRQLCKIKQKRLDALSMTHNRTSVGSKASVEQLVANWLIDTRTTVKESTYTRYYMTVEKHILPSLGKYALRRVDFRTVNRFSAELMASGECKPAFAQKCGGYSVRSEVDF